MHCWGRATDGQLGLGGIEENSVPTPRWNKFLHDGKVVSVGCGLKHTIFLLDDGTMYSCGNNEKGQLGQDSTSTRPGMITALDTLHITQVACGNAHSVAIDNTGTLFTWGDNSCGQLGGVETATENKFFPMRVRSLQGQVIVQVACGGSHTLALSQSGRVFSWGENLHGQLGHSVGEHCVKTPKLIEPLTGLPIVQITAGGSHNFVLTRCMYVYGWGRNNFRQLGLNHSKNVYLPTEVVCLRTERITYISCGDSHTAALNENGEVLTFGCASSGQLGHGELTPPNSPMKVTALTMKEIVQVTCGRMHTLAVDDDGTIHSFGQGLGGQLGLTKTTNVSSPTPIDHDWSSVPPRPEKKSCPLVSDSEEEEMKGGSGSEGECEKTMDKASFKLVVPPEGTSVDPPLTTVEPMDIDEQQGPVSLLMDSTEMERDGVYPKNVSMTSLSRLESQDNSIQSDETEETTIGRLTRVFAGGDQSFACILKVPLALKMDDECSIPSTSACIMDFRVLRSSVALKKDNDEMDTPSVDEEYSLEFSHLSSASSLSSALVPDTARVTTENCCVDIATFQEFFKKLWTMDSGKKLLTALRTQILTSLPTQPVGVESLRVFYVLPILFQKHSIGTELLMEFMKGFKAIHKTSKISSCMGNWFFKESSHEFVRATVKMAKESLHRRVCDLNAQLQSRPSPKIPPGSDRPFIQISPSESKLFRVLLDFLQIFHKWNGEHGSPLKYTEFHEELLFELVDLIKDFFMWISDKTEDDTVVFCKYPFVLDARAKEQLMMVESRIQMKLAVTQAHTFNYQSLMQSQMLSDPSPLAYQLVVNRQTLIKDTMAQLVTTDEVLNFKKPLVVSFVGEEGEDAGGVKKEFFTLLLQEILSPNFGMFLEDDESHMIWFRDNVGLIEVEHDNFILIGILCGLAMYNSVIIDIPFPKAMYKKLLGRSPDISDLVEMFPSVGHSLMDILKYDGNDFTEVFDLNFSITRSVFGEVVTVDLVKDGSSKVVTMENRHEYCAVYVDYVFNSSIKGQFDAFREGFLKVSDGKVLRMIHPDELKTLMVGKQVVNWEELEKYMSYKNGYSPSHSTIRLFWEVFYEFSTDLKKKFLMFYTGSNRIPITGVKNMNMIIQKMDGGPKCNKLPVAHTCFNVLDLPPYETKTKMKEKLLQAINFTSGFGII